MRNECFISKTVIWWMTQRRRRIVNYTTEMTDVYFRYNKQTRFVTKFNLTLNARGRYGIKKNEITWHPVRRLYTTFVGVFYARSLSPFRACGTVRFQSIIVRARLRKSLTWLGLCAARLSQAAALTSRECRYRFAYGRWGTESILLRYSEHNTCIRIKQKNILYDVCICVRMMWKKKKKKEDA